MSDNLHKIVMALVRTGLILGGVLLIAAFFTACIGPFALTLWLEAPTWSRITAGIWGGVFFVFIVSLLYEFES